MQYCFLLELFSNVLMEVAVESSQKMGQVSQILSTVI